MESYPSPYSLTGDLALSRTNPYLSFFHPFHPPSLPQVPSAVRAKVKGSPVVPGSTVKLFEDGEACLYSVTLLKVREGAREGGFEGGRAGRG